MSYYNEYGLINSHNNKEASKNTLLYSLYHIILSNLANEETKELEFKFIEYTEKLRNPVTNRFNPKPKVSLASNSYISQYQYLPICVFSHRFNLSYHKEIWKSLKSRTYDNKTGKVNYKQSLSLSDYIYIGYLNDDFKCKMLLPILSSSLILDCITRFKCKNPKILKVNEPIRPLMMNYGIYNRSKLLTFTQTLCNKLTMHNYWNGLTTIFNIIFPHREHPTHKLTKRINNYNLD